MKKIDSIIRAFILSSFFGLAFATTLLQASAMQTSNDDLYLKSELSPYFSVAENNQNTTVKPILQTYSDYKNTNTVESSDMNSNNASVENTSSVHSFFVNMFSIFTKNNESKSKNQQDENYADKNFFDKLRATIYLAYSNSVDEVTN